VPQHSGYHLVVPPKGPKEANLDGHYQSNWRGAVAVRATLRLPVIPPITRGFRGRRVTTCSFCGKSSRRRTHVEGPTMFISAPIASTWPTTSSDRKNASSPPVSRFSIRFLAAPNKGFPRPVRCRPAVRQEGPGRGGAQSLQTPDDIVRGISRARGPGPSPPEVEIDKSNVLLIAPR